MYLHTVVIYIQKKLCVKIMPNCNHNLHKKKKNNIYTIFVNKTD